MVLSIEQETHRWSAPQPYKSTSCQFGRRPFAPLGHIGSRTCWCYDARLSCNEFLESACVSRGPESPSPAPDRPGSSDRGRRLTPPSLRTNNPQLCCRYVHTDPDMREECLHETASVPANPLPLVSEI